MLIIDQNSNILLIYKGLYSTHGIIFDCLHILLLFNAILPRKKMKKKTFRLVKSWKSGPQNMQLVSWERIFNIYFPLWGRNNKKHFELE